MLKRLLQWDRDTFIFLNNLGIDEWDPFWVVVTSITKWIPLFVFLIILILWLHGRKKGIRMVTTILIMVSFVLVLTKITKDWVARTRPNNDGTINDLIRILKNPTDFSFFSGHAATSFAITVLVYLFLRKKTSWIGLLFIWPLLFAMSRIFVGVHYPIDVIVGAFIGVFSAFLFYQLYNRLIKPYTG